ncbi:hypothetical protein [Prescottella equi]|uniref:hypothetical protein n=1 Tax=Rhodococcus hoagii TaxID=43767 RepID=UPI003D99EF08
MKRSDISDSDVVQACGDARAAGGSSLGLLIARTNAPRKVAIAAMERALDRDLIEYGVSIAYAWPNDDGASYELEDGPPQLAGRDFSAGATYKPTINELVQWLIQTGSIPKSRLIDIDANGIGRCRLCSYTYSAYTGWQLPDDPRITGGRP